MLLVRISPETPAILTAIIRGLIQSMKDVFWDVTLCGGIYRLNQRASVASYC
jgi:hypothetical protein